MGFRLRAPGSSRCFRKKAGAELSGCSRSSCACGVEVLGKETGPVFGAPCGAGAMRMEEQSRSTSAAQARGHVASTRASHHSARGSQAWELSGGKMPWKEDPDPRSGGLGLTCNSGTEGESCGASGSRQPGPSFTQQLPSEAFFELLSWVPHTGTLSGQRQALA